MSTLQSTRTFALACIGLSIRIFILANFKDQIKPRVEITTPVNSWKRAYEAVHLWNSGLNPYSGGIFHEYPISLQFYKIIISYFNVDLVFAVTDVVTAILLQLSTYNQLVIGNESSKEVASSRSMKVLLLYLFSPITILACCGTSTSTFTNFLIALISFILPMKPFRALTCVLCALLICNNIFYGILILPIFLCLEYCSSKKSQSDNDNRYGQQVKQYYEHQNFRESLTTSIVICLAAIGALQLASYFLMDKSWTFINSSYLYVLKIEDLTPNIGMFWYLFTEMFEHFLEFFTWVVQMNAFIHFIPLSLCLRDNPFFALYALVITSTISQPYPSLSNIGIITSLIPQWSNLLPHMKKGLIVYSAGITCMTLWPVFWHLWIIMGTANSNFYFGATLAFTVSLTLFLIDLLGANEKVRHSLKTTT